MATLKHQALGNYAWMRVIERAHLPQQVKVVAFILAINANADGSGARIGEERLADTAICTARYVQDSLDVLKHLGLVEITKYGRLAGDANTYQLTTPGQGFPAVPMRRDHEGNPINPDGTPRSEKLSKQSKPLSVRPLLAQLQGEPLPDRPMPIERADNPDPDPAAPVDNPAGTGNPVPLRLVGGTEVTDEFRQPGAATDPVDNPAYRQRVADVSATGCGPTGNQVPPTNSYQLLPTNSPQATHSPTPNDQACGQPEDDEDADPEYENAHAVLAAMRPTVAATAWRIAARRELEANDIPLSKRAVDIHAAYLATRPVAAAAADGAA